MPENNINNSNLNPRVLNPILKLLWRQPFGSISLIIIVLCTSVFICIGILDILNIIDKQTTIAILGLSRFGIFHQIRLYQFLTAPLVHLNIFHLLFNMLALWMLGPEIEKALGRRQYIVFSFLCATSSMIGFLLLNWGTGNIVLGYSGVIFGILVAQAILRPNNVIHFFAFFPLKMKYAVLILGVIELYLTVSPDSGGVAHAAHLFGALAALIYLRRQLVWKALALPWITGAHKLRGKRYALLRSKRNIPREL